MQQWVLREKSCLIGEASVADCQALVVQKSHLFTQLLLLPNLLFKIGDIEEQSINLGGPLDQDLTLEVRTEGVSLRIQAYAKLIMGHLPPALEEPVQFCAIKCISHVGCISVLLLEFPEVEDPVLPDILDSEKV